jgi:hypothetical protein
MIDTVRKAKSYLLNRDFRHFFGWQTLDGRSDLRVFCKKGRIECWEVSLPRLLFESNAKLISCQNEIDSALQKAEMMIQTMGFSRTNVFLWWRVRKGMSEIYPRITLGAFQSKRKTSFCCPTTTCCATIYPSKARNSWIWKYRASSAMSFLKVPVK